MTSTRTCPFHKGSSFSDQSVVSITVQGLFYEQEQLCMIVRPFHKMEIWLELFTEAGKVSDPVLNHYYHTLFLQKQFLSTKCG